MTQPVDSKVSSERLAEMLDGLDGLPPGPWDDGVHHRASFGGREYAHITSPIDLVPIAAVPLGVEGYGFEDGAARARHIARCDPDTMRQIITLAQEALSLRSPVPEEAVAWQHRLWFDDAQKWSAWRDGKNPRTVDNDFEERPLFLHPSPVGAVRKLERWYLGSQNDGLFIINTPPRPSNDYPWHDRPDGPTLVIPLSDMPRSEAMKIVDAHNAALNPIGPA